MEYEYSFKVSDIREYINYFENHKYQFKSNIKYVVVIEKNTKSVDKVY